MALFQTDFISYSLMREVQMNVIVPTMTCPESMGMGLKEGEKPSHAGNAPYPVLYLLQSAGSRWSPSPAKTKATGISPAAAE